MEYHPAVGKIVSMLKEKDVWYETFEHEPVRTSEEAAKIRHGYTISQGAKALILKVKFATGEKKFVMVVLPGDKRINGSKLKKELQIKESKFATEEEVGQITNGVQIGGVPPFGNLFGLSVYVDDSLFANEKIIFNAGDRSFSVAMKAMDYKNIVGPKVVNVIE